MKFQDTNIVNAGRFDQRLTIQQATNAKSATGEDLQTWATFATVWAAVRLQFKGRETFDAGRDNSEKWVQVEMHRLKGVREEMRMLWSSQLLGDVTLDIRSVEFPTDRSLYMLLTCRILR